MKLSLHIVCSVLISVCVSALWAPRRDHGLTEKRLAIVVPSYNNKDYFEQNLESIYNQEYDNYYVIYIDDNSVDGTGERVWKYIKDHHQEHRTIFIQNHDRQRAMANIYRAIHYFCKDADIVVQPDGDDYFADNQVFQRINQWYEEDIWFTYGQFRNYPTGELGYCKPVDPEIVENQWLRRKWWKPGQLRTFKAWLFKQIPLKDFIFTGPYWQGDFFPANCDLAMCYPMMEMAGFKFKFIEEVIYIRNLTPINDFKVNQEVQVLGSKLIRHKPVYPRLGESREGWFDWCKEARVDALILSRNPHKLAALLHSISQFAYGIDRIAVMYESNAHNQEQFNQLETQYNNLTLYKVADLKHTAVIQALSAFSNKHTLLLTDTWRFTHFVDCTQALAALEQTFAYCMSFSLGMEAPGTSYKHAERQEAPAHCWLWEDVYAWMIGFGAHDWKAVNNYAATLYRTADLLSAYAHTTSATIAQIEQEWAKKEVNQEEMALCFATPKGAHVI